MTSAMPVQCSNQLSYEVKQLKAGQFVGLMFSSHFQQLRGFVAQLVRALQPTCTTHGICTFAVFFSVSRPFFGFEQVPSLLTMVGCHVGCRMSDFYKSDVRCRILTSRMSDF